MAQRFSAGNRPSAAQVPPGTTENSPALQRWEPPLGGASPARDDRKWPSASALGTAPRRRKSRQGRPKIAQRFSAGNHPSAAQVPPGTTENGPALQRWEPP